MTNRTSIIILFVLLTCATCFGQSSYMGLTPGKSTRVEAERVFGQPVKKVSETLVEYRPQPLTSKVYVQYKQGSQVIERIEVFCLPEKGGFDFFEKLNLTMTDNDWEADRDDDPNKEIKYYRAPFYVVLTELKNVKPPEGYYAVLQRVAFYSRELYEAAITSPQVKSVFGRCALCRKER